MNNFDCANCMPLANCMYLIKEAHFILTLSLHRNHRVWTLWTMWTAAAAADTRDMRWCRHSVLPFPFACVSWCFVCVSLLGKYLLTAWVYSCTFSFLTTEVYRNIQKRATKLVIILRKLRYKERLISLKLHTLKYRRLRGDMVEVVKIVNGIYDEKVAPRLHFNKSSVTRGNNFKLHNQTFTHNFRKHFFSARIVNIWNSLPNWVVDVQSRCGLIDFGHNKKLCMIGREGVLCGMRNFCKVYFAEFSLRNVPQITP